MTREVKNFGGFTMVKEIDTNRASITWSGEETKFGTCLKAGMQFNTWADELFKSFMQPEEQQEYLDAWKSANDEMGEGKEVVTRVIGADGFIECVISHSDPKATTEVIFYRRTEEG